MIFQPKQNRRGFTLVELTIVLGVFAAIVAALWSLVSIARQKARVEEAMEAIFITVDGTRSLYGSQGSIVSGYDVIVPALNVAEVIPKTLVRSATSTCNGTTSYYADTPWSVSPDVCGTYRVCGWFNGSGACTTGAIAASQYFAIEFTQLNYASCLALATGVYPTHPVGLVDVLINKKDATGSGQPLPVPVSWASNAAQCAATGNIVDFVYRLRQPVS